MTKNYHLITVRYIPATNFKGSRVKIYSYRFKKGITIPFDYSLNSIDEMAIKKLKQLKFKIIGSGESKEGYTIISNTFKSL